MRQRRAASTRESLYLICGLVAFTQASWGLVVPVLPVYAHQFGATAAQLGVLVSSFSVARIAVNIPAGMLADRIDRRIVVLVAVGAAGVVLAATAALRTGAGLVTVATPAPATGWAAPGMSTEPSDRPPVRPSARAGLPRSAWP